MTRLATCELCLFLWIACVLFAHLNGFIYTTELYISVCCAGNVPPHKASGTCQHTDCRLSSSSHWAATVACHEECSAVTEGELVRLSCSWCLCLFSVHESVITKQNHYFFHSFIIYLFHSFIHLFSHSFIYLSINYIYIYIFPPPRRYTTLSGCVFYSPLSGFSLLAYEVTWSHTTTRHSR